MNLIMKKMPVIINKKLITAVTTSSPVIRPLVNYCYTVAADVPKYIQMSETGKSAALPTMNCHTLKSVTAHA
jgi:hypothetical protein